ncbi:uncharacterized protein C3orf14-like isoform X1 [Asterias rubens]|uniref:uncharacterized protein C3orf14-like isoform X1 n=1 Tax=Asterias rubens TaxID=7604 RepID=UPI0014553626|nr:uncharacterized protein C3orf14-like isoform X1 [Asterias rubens]
MDRWLQKEIELNQKHEEILVRREALLKQTELRLGDTQELSASVAHHWGQAKQRNQELIQEIVQCQTEARIQSARPSSFQLTALKERYWEMVEKETPKWKEEVKKAKRDKINPPSAR